MNKQRKVVITTTYNEMGIIIDTKVEEVAQPNLQPTCNQLATDCINRQAAIDALDKRFDSIPMEQTTEILQLRKDLRELPPAQPERKKGKWIIKDNPGTGWYRVTCSECGEDVTSTAPCIGFYPNAKVTWDYCPNCGADMREVDDERV